MLTLADIEAARDRIAGGVSVTPCAPCVWLEPHTGGPAYLKLENLQTSGSFKERGALNKLLTLTPDERARGVVAASAGNHAQAVALHARRLGIKALIVMPETTPSIKVMNTRRYEAEVVLAGANYDAARDEAARLAAARGLVMIHAFDDPAVVAGQGTCGLEILDQIPDVAAVFVPVGGGGLAGGMAAAIKGRKPGVRVVGVETKLVPSMAEALKKHAPVVVEGGRTLADGIAVRQVSPLTLALAEKYLDDVVLIDEEDIAAAVLFLVEREKTVAEGAGAAAVAALLGGHGRGAGGPVCAVVTGGNIDVTMLGKILDRGLVRDGRLVRLRLRVVDRPGGLAEVLGIVAKLGGNVIEIQHERTFTHALYNDVEVFLTLETQGAAHVAEIVGALDRIAALVETV